MRRFTKIVRSLAACAIACSAFETAWAQGSFVVLDEGFESDYKPANWTFVDKDEDGLQWNLGTDSPDGAKAHGGTHMLFSLSQNPETSKAIRPDNWVISPALGLRADAELTFWVAVGDVEHGAEHFGVFASKTDKNVESFTEKLFEKTFDTKMQSKLRSTPSKWVKFSVKVPKDSRYIAFRHFACEGQFLLLIDDILMTSSAKPEVATSFIKINGKELASTEDNADVLGDGTVRYSAADKTLAFKNASMDQGALEVFGGELYIQLEGVNDITLGSEETALLINKDASVTIAGDGELSLSTFGNAAIGLMENAKLTIRGAKVSADGSLAGILGAYGNKGETLILVGTDLYATGMNASVASLERFELIQCRIASPEGAEVKKGKLAEDDNLAMGIYDADGMAVSAVQIEPNIAEGSTHKVFLKLEGVGSIKAKGYTEAQLTKVMQGATIPLELTFDANLYELESLKANGKDIAASLEAVMEDKDLEIIAVLRKRTSIDNLSVQAVHLYPNPADKVVTIAGLEGKQSIAVALYNRAGVLLGQETLQDEWEFSTAHLTEGIYFVKLQGGAVYKLIIKH